MKKFALVMSIARLVSGAASAADLPVKAASLPPPVPSWAGFYIAPTVVLFLAAAILSPGAASAADMALKAPPRPAPILLWNGFYVGGNLGAAWSSADFETTNTPGVPAIFGNPANIAAVSAAGTGSFSQDAVFTGGVQAGYNWQVTPVLLAGIEADINSLRLNGNVVGVAATTIGLFPVTTSLSTDWLATVRGRIGITRDRALFYVTGGAAFTEQKFSQSDNALLGAIPITGASFSSSTRAGWTGGGGIEYMFWSRWSVKAEYLFAHFDGLSTTTTVNAVGLPNFQTLFAKTNHLDLNIARVGLNYHFGGGPVVAKY